METLSDAYFYKGDIISHLPFYDLAFKLWHMADTILYGKTWHLHLIFKVFKIFKDFLKSFLRFILYFIYKSVLPAYTYVHPMCI